MKSRILSVVGIVLITVSAAGCQSDQERSNIGRAAGVGAGAGALLGLGMGAMTGDGGYALAGAATGKEQETGATGIVRSNVRIEIRSSGTNLFVAETYVNLDGEETKVQEYRFIKR